MKPEEIDLLVMDYKSGDQRALQKLYRHFVVPMHRFAIARTGEASSAEDLVQNVWLKINKRVVMLQDVSLFRSWLYKALRWEILDWQRADQKTLVCESPTADVTVNDIDTDVLDLMPSLRQLEAKERDVVELFYLNELSVNETALVLGVPVGTVKSRLARARETLRQYYES